MQNLKCLMVPLDTSSGIASTIYFPNFAHKVTRASLFSASSFYLFGLWIIDSIATDQMTGYSSLSCHYSTCSMKDE